MDNVCGNCKYNEYNQDTELFVCDNEESEMYGLETDYDDTCIDYEERAY